MPYSGADDPNLPENVKKMPAKKRRQWVDIFNSVYKSCIDGGGTNKTCEPSAFAQANGVLKKEESRMPNLFDAIKKLIGRSIKSVDTWNGAASQYADADAYCSACLIDVNSAAGKDPKVENYCMLPVREPGDAASVYVDKAVHAAAGGHGITQVKKPSDVPQADWDKAIKAAASKLISAYTAMSEVAPDAVYELAGKTPPENRAKNLLKYIFLPIDTAVREQDPQAWLNDVYADEDTGDLFAIITSQGKLYKAAITLGADNATVGEWVECKLDFPTLRTIKTRLIHQADGKVRWLSIACSSVLNRMGEIDSRALFQSFLDNIERTGEYPVRQFYHCGMDFVTGQVDFVAVDDNLLLMSGVYNDTELAKREIAARELDSGYWGESIGFLPTAPPKNLEIENGVTIPVYAEGKLVEESTCAEHDACAWFTSTIIVEEVNRMLEKRQMDALIKLFGGDEDAAKDWLKNNVDEVNRQIADNGLITLTVDVNEPIEPVEPVADLTPAPVPVPEPPNVEVDEPTIHAIGDYILEGMQTRITEATQPLVEAIAGITTRLETAEKLITEYGKMPERLSKLEIDEEERKRVWLEDAPPRPTVRVSHRPRTEEPEPLPKPDTYADIASETLAGLPFK
jgi:hypothetical protein